MKTQITHHVNGNVQTSVEYKDDTPHGLYIKYFDNGNLHIQTFYQHGKKHGTEVEFNMDGTIKKISNYCGGHLKGYQFYNHHGKVNHAWHDGTHDQKNIIKFIG